MERSAMELISDRLASIEDLYFPRSFLDGAAASDHSCRRTALLDLLSRDASIFLERYGSELTVNELFAFDKIKENYEVRWHLNKLRSSREPTAEEEKTRAAIVKNRRRAYLDELIRGGEYFSEDAMREREPYLHHEYVGKFQDPVGRGMPRPGERWSDTLMRQAEEACIMQKIRGEQERLGVPRKDWVGGAEEVEEEEEDEDEEEDEELASEEDVSEKKVPNSSTSQLHMKSETNDPCATVQPSEAGVSSEEMQDQLEQFTRIMQQKFLTGKDSLDYSRIDNNERLDDHWLKEANYDAEEKYFAEE